jgi:nicotinate-nucleotide adenylyltransferase
MATNRVGIFGGSFDPIHYGHLNSMETVAERLNLDKIKVIPTCKSPLRPQTQGASVEQRLEMCRLGVSELEHLVEIDEVEIRRGGVSYTIDTLKSLQKEEPNSQFYLIIGLDQLGKFGEWKDYEQILKSVDLVVTSRPGMEFPYSLEKLPAAVRTLVADFDGRQVLLKGGHTIYFIQLQDVEASATEIRKKIRLGQGIQHLVPMTVAEYIQKNHLYESVAKNIGDFKKFTVFCAQHLKEKGGISVRAFDLTKLDAPTEYSLIASGTSTRHATSIAESLVKEVKKEYNIWPLSIEGTSEGRWVVVDYGSLIVHSFYDFVRNEYRLEQLWKGGTELSL